MKLIPLTQGKFAKVSDAQFERVAQFSSWYYCDGYARTTKGRKTLWMHVFIKPPPKGLEVDHIDGDGLNNQNENLRHATHSQQAQNRRRSNKNESGVTGVTWNNGKRKWRARMKINGRSIRDTHFTSFDEAIDKRRQWEEQFFGEFVCQNPDRLLTKPPQGAINIAV